MKLFSLLPKRLIHFACNSPPAQAAPDRMGNSACGPRGDRQNGRRAVSGLDFGHPASIKWNAL